MHFLRLKHVQRALYHVISAQSMLEVCPSTLARVTSQAADQEDMLPLAVTTTGPW